MVKLSKSQQEVVDKMNDGYELKHTAFCVWLKHRKCGLSLKVRYDTFKALCRIGVIVDSLTRGTPRIYQLTEQYKTKPE